MQYVFDTLPVHPLPKPLEDFVSYFTRLGAENGVVNANDLATLLFQSNCPRPENIADYPMICFDKMSEFIIQDVNTLRATTFYYIAYMFERSVSPNRVSRFLGGMISKTLRYCPLCIQKYPWYILPWRFNILTGCPTHMCQLEDRCPECASTLPLLASPLSIGRCSTCGGDLRAKTPTQINLEELVIVEQRFNDLALLLRPTYAYPDNTGMAGRIGQQYTILRMKGGISVKDIANQLGVKDTSISNLEWGKVQQGSMPFRLYVSYADVLGTSLKSICEAMWCDNNQQIDEVQDSLGRYHRIYLGESKGEIVIRRSGKWTDESMLAAIQQVRSDIESSGVEATNTLIINTIGVGYRNLKRFPQSEAFLHKLTKDKQERLVELHEEKVMQAISQITSNNMPISGKSISRVSGVSYNVLLRWPQLRVMINNATGKPFPAGGKDCLTAGVRPRNRIREREMREDNIIVRVNEAIRILKNDGRLVTQPNVCEVAGLTKSTLGHYPRARELINQVAKEFNEEIKSRKYIERENELLCQVEECINAFLQEDKWPSQSGVARLVGMSVSSLKAYPKIRTLLDRLKQGRDDGEVETIKG